MSIHSVKFGPPPIFKITESTELEDWKKWQRSFRYYSNSINLDQQSHDFQLSTFKSLIGPDALEIYNTFSLVDITDVESVMKKFDEHFKPKVNKTVERYKLYKMSQSSDQKFDDFLSAITNQVNKCDFKAFREEILLYKIVGGICNDEIRSALLADESLGYDQAVQICRASSMMHFMSGDENINPDSAKKKLSKAVSKDKKEKVVSVKPGSSKKSSKAQEFGAVEKFLKANVPDIKISGTFSVDGSSLEQHGGVLIESTSTKNSDHESAKPSTSDRNQDDRPDVGSDLGSDAGSDWRAGNDDFDDDEDEDVIIRTSDPSVDLVIKASKKSSDRKRRRRRTIQADGPPVCNVCMLECGSYLELRKHLATHSWGGKVNCYYCGKEFNHKRYLTKHFILHHGDAIGTPAEVYTCDVCGYKTTYKNNLRRHKFQHSDERPYSCELCAYQCIVPHLMVEHMVKHTGQKPLACPDCDKRFVTRPALKNHRMSHLPPEKKVKWVEDCTCDICGKTFCHKTALKTHQVIHTGERPYACSFCDYRGKVKSAFQTHMMIHNNEKPFVCSVCGYACRQKQILTGHMRTHTGEKPHPCSLCPARFRQTSHLHRHMLVHTGEKPFVCDICGHRWTTQSNLKQHMRVHRNELNDPSKYSGPRKRRKKPVIIIAEAMPDDPTSTAIPQWSEQVTTINYPMESLSNLAPSPYHPSYSANQAVQIKQQPDCRYYQ